MSGGASSAPHASWWHFGDVEKGKGREKGKDGKESEKGKRKGRGGKGKGSKGRRRGKNGKESKRKEREDGAGREEFFAIVIFLRRNPAWPS